MKDSYYKPMSAKNTVRSNHWVSLDDSFSFDKDGYVIPKGISL